MRSDIRLIKEAMGIKASPATEEITPRAILDALEAQKNQLRNLTLNNFAYFKLDDDARPNTDGMAELWLHSSGPVFTINYWISDMVAQRNANDPRYWSIDQRKPLIAIADPTQKVFKRALPVGNYIIEFDALNGHWNEYLSIYLENGKLKQKIHITNSNGAIIYDFETSK